MKKYHYSRNWHIWSRVLTDSHSGACNIVEVNLTPINLNPNGWKDEVAPIVIRAHCTTSVFPSFSDRLIPGFDHETDEIPLDVYRAMVDNLGEVLTKRLLTEDFLPQINWGKYESASSGGARLDDVR